MGARSRDGCRVVYVILAHNQPELFGRLVRSLQDPRVRFVVHIDARADIAPFEQAVKGVYGVEFVTDRVRVRWAAFSQVESTLRSMRLALDQWGEAPTHHVVLSGVDYPLRSNDEIIDALEAKRNQQIVRRFDIRASGDDRQIRRIRARHFRQIADRNTLARKPLFAIEWVLRAVPRRIPPELAITSGSNWIAVTPAFSAWCLRFGAVQAKTARLFKGMFGPDEIYFHSLLDNSPFAGSAPGIEPYYDVTQLGGPWRYGNLHYLNPVQDIVALERIEGPLTNPEVLFARKFSLPTSMTVLDVIDARRAGAGRPGGDH